MTNINATDVILTGATQLPVSTEKHNSMKLQSLHYECSVFLSNSTGLLFKNAKKIHMHTSISISAYFEPLIFSDMVGRGAMPTMIYSKMSSFKAKPG